jgi:hypothetical protein
MNYLSVLPSVLRIGDVLSRPKALSFVEHFGVVIGTDRVLHNTPEKGEHVSSVAQFAAGENLTVHRREVHVMSLLARTQHVLTKPRRYNLLTRNCEHTLSEVLWGVAKSPTFIIVALLAAAVVLCLALRGR